MPELKLVNQSVRSLLEIGPFGGLDASTDPFYVDEKRAIATSNIVPNRTYAAYATMRGRTLSSTKPPGTKFFGGTFYDANPIGNGALPLIVVATQNGQYVEFSWANAINEPFNLVTLPSLALQNPVSFESYMGWLFESHSDFLGNSYKFDQYMEPTFWQILPPTVAPTGGTPTNGNVYGSGYYYGYTYASAESPSALESSPSPFLGPLNLGIINSPPTTNSALGLSAAPSVGQTTGGSIATGTYYIACTVLIGGVESGLGPSVVLNLVDNKILVALLNPGIPGATGFNVYISTDNVDFHLQSPTNNSFGPTGIGITSYASGGAAAPSAPGGNALNAPSAPIVKAIAGGSLAARTEYYVITYLDGNGNETNASGETQISLMAGQIAEISAPLAVAGAVDYNVYGSTSSGEEVLQNASPIPVANGWTEPTTGLILGQQIVLTAPGSTDPQVADVNFYRIGGSLGQWLFIGSVANNASGNVTYTDNTNDADVTGQALVLARDPPAPFNAIRRHKNRIFGFGYRSYTQQGVEYEAALSDLWYSNYNEPWGFDNVNQVIPVDSQVAGDIGVQLVEVGSDLMCIKSRTCWMLYGDAPDSFYLQKLFDIGACCKNAVVEALGVVFWLSNQGVYMFDGSTLTYISKDIKKQLDSFSEADFAAASAFFSDRMYWISFPTQGISFGYDTVTNTWWPSSFYATDFIFNPEVSMRPTAPDYVIGLTNQSMLVDLWFAAETDRNQPIVSTLTSRIASTSGEVSGVLRCSRLEVNATIPANASVTATIDANPGLPPNPFSWTFGPSALPRQIVSIPPGIQGQLLQLSLEVVSSSAFILESAGVYGWVRRLLNQYG